MNNVTQILEGHSEICLNHSKPDRIGIILFRCLFQAILSILD